MKKMLTVLAVLLLMAGVAFAGTISITGMNAGTINQESRDSFAANHPGWPMYDAGLYSVTTNPSDSFTFGYPDWFLTPTGAWSWPTLDLTVGDVVINKNYTLRELSGPQEMSAAYAWYINFNNPDYQYVSNEIRYQFFGCGGNCYEYEQAAQNFGLQDYFDIAFINLPEFGPQPETGMRLLVYNPHPVPEPCSMLLFGTGLLFLCRKILKGNAVHSPTRFSIFPPIS